MKLGEGYCLEGTIRHTTLMANHSVEFLLDLSCQALAIRGRILVLLKTDF